MTSSNRRGRHSCSSGEARASDILVASLEAGEPPPLSCVIRYRGEGKMPATH